MRVVLFSLMLLPFNYAHSDELVFRLFSDFVKFSSSVDAYSKVCIRNFNGTQAQEELFDLVDSLRENVNLSENELNQLRDKYSRIGMSTQSQLRQLGLNRKKNLCKKYLKIFERFDKKKNEKLLEIVDIIDG